MAHFTVILAAVLSIATAGDTDADITMDGAVNGDDLAIVLALWGHEGRVAADLNGDFFVDFDDLLIVLSAWTD